MKPLIFLSHSSRDRELVNRIKALLERRTGGALTIFCSSDGESVPFGRNWVRATLSALDKAKLLFAFLSPGSLDSQWIFFELGFAYKRDIPAVPVGIAGVDVVEAHLPLDFLQGFNLEPDGLSTMIRVINETFLHKHSTVFTDADYDTLRTHIVRTVSLGNGDHWFQVFSIDPNGEVAHERIEVHIEGTNMGVRSTRRGEAWESVGILNQGRYAGRFKFSRGGSPDDIGSHDFVWNGKEFVGSAKLDSGRWYADKLIWRPVVS